MIERGMIFNAEMVRAILDGRKTQTRRPVKFPILDRNLGCELAGNELAGELAAGNYLNSAFGKPGHRIWVRETWTRESIDAEDGSYSPDYRATANGQPHSAGNHRCARGAVELYQRRRCRQRGIPRRSITVWGPDG